MRGRISDEYKHKLSHRQQGLAVRIIRAMNRVSDTEARSAKYRVANRLLINRETGKWMRVRLSTTATSPHKVICEGIVQGFIPSPDYTERCGVQAAEKRNSNSADSIWGYDPAFQDKEPGSCPTRPSQGSVQAATSVPNPWQQGEQQAEDKPPALPAAPTDPIDFLEQKFDEIIKYCDREKRSDGRPMDKVSNATYKYASQMVKVGIPPEAILHAYALTWPDTARQAVGIKKYNPAKFGKAKDGQHKAVPYVEALIEAQVPVLLIGPTQSGKGYLARNIADNKGLPFGSVPLSEGVNITWLFGRNMPNEFVSTEFRDTYKDGGVFLADEMDASDPNLLLSINDALTNDELSNPMKNERLVKSDEFYIIGAANTPGEGADADYVGRSRLDAATLERFRMGRVMIDYDRDIQKMLLRGEA